MKKYKTGPLMSAISRKIGRAIADYDMLHDGDKVIVAVSGGKDSSSLLPLLRYRQTFAPIKFELLAVHVRFGNRGVPPAPLGDRVAALGVPLLVENVESEIVREGESLNCFWCAWHRRKTLFKMAGRLGFNKIALGHHFDDIVETILLNLFYRGEVGAMKPRQDLFGGKLSIIRPLAYVDEAMVRRFFLDELKGETLACTCPRREETARLAVKNLLKDLEKQNPRIKWNIFRALRNIKEEYLLDTADEIDAPFFSAPDRR